MRLDRWRRLLPGLWAGLLLGVAALGTPSAFALLARADAGRVAGRMLAHEAYASLALGMVMLILERSAARRGAGPQFGAGVALAAGALFCTIAGHFALLPLMEAARAGAGTYRFAELHAVSTAFYGVKLVLVIALAWRATAITAPPSS